MRCRTISTMNIYHVLTVLAGLILPLQIAFNNKLTSYSGNPVTTSLISFLVGTLALLIYSLTHFSAMQKSLLQIHQAPFYAWMGGLIGALYVITTVVASPRIGIATFMTLIIGGQLLMSLILDNYGWLGAAVKAINVSKVAGMALVVIGILLIKR